MKSFDKSDNIAMKTQTNGFGLTGSDHINKNRLAYL